LNRARRRGDVERIVLDALQIPAEFSGVGRQALMIGAQLQQLPPGLTLEVRCPADVRMLLECAFPRGTRFRTPLRHSRPRLLRLLYQQLAAPLLDRRSTLLVCLGDQGPLWGRARVLLVVNDVRRLLHPETSGALERAFYRVLVPLAVRHATSVATISEFSAHELKRALRRPAAIRVIAHHPPPRVDAPRRRPVDGHLLSVGALRAYKGPETAIDALAALEPKERPELLLVGPAEGRAAELGARAQAAGVADRVRLLGWLDEAELEPLYECALATVNPSTYEGYGLPVAESLARGLPTIASDIPPHREIGGDDILYFAPGDPRSLAGCFRRLVREPELWRTLARSALERARELQRARPTWRDVILEAARPDA
jgi:glycosyltransferase involved in cell wall biosynthesis